MSRMILLELGGDKLTFEMPNFNTDNEQLDRAGDGVAKALNTVEPLDHCRAWRGVESAAAALRENFGAVVCSAGRAMLSRVPVALPLVRAM